MKKFLTIILSVTVLVGSFPQLISSQNCGCASEIDYCKVGSDSGTCNASGPVSVADVVTDAFFNGIADQAASTCAGKGFYNRSAFLEALNSYSQFGTVGSVEVSKREIAAFFAHVTHSTGHLCYVEQIDPSMDYCDKTNTQYPCVPGKRYYGRGPIQISWNSNYGPAGQSIGFNGLSEPETVATNNVISFKTALWFWMNNCHSLITSGQGFGATIRAINGKHECDGAGPESVGARIKFYTEYCNQLDVAPGDNIRC